MTNDFLLEVKALEKEYYKLFWLQAGRFFWLDNESEPVAGIDRAFYKAMDEVRRKRSADNADDWRPCECSKLVIWRQWNGMQPRKIERSGKVHRCWATHSVSGGKPLYRTLATLRGKHMGPDSLP